MASTGSRIQAWQDTCDYNPLSAEQKHAAALLVCANSEDADGARDLMLALGLMPGQENEEFTVAPFRAM